jgi:hypothetical protein
VKSFYQNRAPSVNRHGVFFLNRTLVDDRANDRGQSVESQALLNDRANAKLSEQRSIASA